MQRSNAFYPGWVYTIPTFILRLPFSAVEGIVWSICVYWLVGLDPEPGRFFMFMLILTLMHQLSISLFRYGFTLPWICSRRIYVST